MEAYLSGGKLFVKPHFSPQHATDHFADVSLKMPTKIVEILCSNAVPHSSLKSRFTFLMDSP
ncbi:DUF5951 family protein [Atlantibacter sp. RC6]|uniref:DUF5951 family protein n=1 Tax=Atlantibacter sp. RC6 TaxID=2587036 RepID=UPI001C848C04